MESLILPSVALGSPTMRSSPRHTRLMLGGLAEDYIRPRPQGLTTNAYCCCMR